MVQTLLIGFTPSLKRERDKFGRFMEQKRTFMKAEGIVFGKCVYKKRHAAAQQSGRPRGTAEYLRG